MHKPISAVVLPLALLAAVVAVPGCSYRPGYQDNPVTRSLSWFSYLNADDLRAYCRAGGPDRYRIVYNGNRDEQVRTYDITGNAAGGAELVIQVSGGADLSAPIPLDDLLSPWRGRIERTVIGCRQLRDVRDALRASGFDTPPPDGTRVYSWSFFWLVAACEGGRFRYNGWDYPSARFEKVVLEKPLAAVDVTGIAFNRPRETERPRNERGHRDYYQLLVTPSGIKDHFTPF